MKKLIAAAAVLMISAPALSAEKSPEYSEAFCAGFNQATALIAQRAETWMGTVLAGVEGNVEVARQPPAARKMISAVNALNQMVLLPKIASKLQIEGGDTVDCAPKEKPAEQPAAKEGN